MDTATSFEDEQQKQKAMREMERILGDLRAGKITVKHCWLVQDYEDAGENHYWFSLEWEVKEWRLERAWRI